MRHLCTIDDLGDDQIAWLLDRASARADGTWSISGSASRLLGLLFLEPSLRTRIGFATAAARLGWASVEIHETRATAPEYAESVDDTIRVASGMCDLIVVRPGQPLSQLSGLSQAMCPVVNGGDNGSGAEHPTQALIDLFVIERLRGPLGGLHVAIVGDATMRATRSLLSLFARRRPQHLTVVTHASSSDRAKVLLARAGAVVETRLPAAVDADVVYVGGMPHASVPVAVRREFVIDESFMAGLSPSAIVMSPMPVMDEIADDVRSDDRMEFFAQSDLSVHMRAAILEMESASE